MPGDILAVPLFPAQLLMNARGGITEIPPSCLARPKFKSFTGYLENARWLISGELGSAARWCYEATAWPTIRGVGAAIGGGNKNTRVCPRIQEMYYKCRNYIITAIHQRVYPHIFQTQKFHSHEHRVKICRAKLR